MARPVLACTLSLLLAAPVALAGGAVDDAMAALKEGEYAKAAEIAEKVAADDADFAKARYVAGESRLALGENEAAEKAFREALDRKPDSVPVLSGLGRTLTAKGAHEEAMKLLNKAVAADGKDATAHRSLGECLAAQGKAAEARKELEQAAKLDPKDALAARALVECLVKAGELKPAARVAEAYRAADPKAAMGDFLRGLVLDRMKEGKDAIAAYEAALAKDPKFLDAHKNLAILCVTDNPVYSDKERTAKAMEHFAKYFELGGKDEELRQTYEQIKGFVGSPKAK
jgi:tetratricopeptide (TPR) repeat protein